MALGFRIKLLKIFAHILVSSLVKCIVCYLPHRTVGRIRWNNVWESRTSEMANKYSLIPQRGWGERKSLDYRGFMVYQLL